MHAATRLLHAMHLSALGVWLGVLLMSGATAAVVFPAMKGLAPALPGYGRYTGEHWRLAAGQVQARVFSIADLAGLVCFGIAAVTLAAGWGRRQRGVVIGVRCAALAVLLASIAYRSLAMNPAMSGALTAYWDAARAGDNDRAAANLGAFQEFHGLATGLLAVDAAAVLAALMAGAWAGAPARAGQ